MKTILELYLKVIAGIGKFLNWGSITMLGLLAVATLVDVIGRSFFDSPITGGYELTELSLVLIVALGLGKSELLKRHVRVDLLMANVSPKIRKKFDLVNNLISSAICFLLGWRTILHAQHLRKVGTTSGLLDLSLFPFVLLFGIGFVVIGGVFLSEFLEDNIKGS